MAINFKKAIIQAAETLEERAVLDWLHNQWATCGTISFAEMELHLGLKRPAIVNVLGTLQDKGLIVQTDCAWEEAATFTPRSVMHLKLEQMELPIDGEKPASAVRDRKGGTDQYRHPNGDLYKAYATAQVVGGDYDGNYELRIARLSAGSTTEFDVYTKVFTSLRDAWDAFDDYILPLKWEGDVLLWARNQEPGYSVARGTLVLFVDEATDAALKAVVGDEPDAKEFRLDRKGSTVSVFDVAFERFYSRSDDGARWPGLDAAAEQGTDAEGEGSLNEWAGYQQAVDHLKLTGCISTKEMTEQYGFTKQQIDYVLARMEGDGLIKHKRGAKSWFYIVPTAGGDN